MLTHIIQDFRIVGSIINCFFIRLRCDKANDLEIANQMKSRLNLPNSLERIVKRQKLSNSANFSSIDSCSDLDFPRMTRYELECNITLGVYQIEQGFGYIREHFEKNGDFQLLVCDKLIESESTRIVSSMFYSRHRSETIYKVFVQFNIQIRTIDSIIGWFCNCKVGSRTVGCCSHVAAIIYYLSIGKYHQPKELIKYETYLKNAKLTKSSSQPISKRNLSSQTQSQITGTQKKMTFTQPDSAYSSFPHIMLSESQLISSFISRLPTWGGRFCKTVSSQYANFSFINTCSIDYLLFCFWISSKLSSKSLSFLDSFRNQNICKAVQSIIEMIETNQWDNAKSVWVFEVCKLNPTRRCFDLFNSEFEAVNKYVNRFQEYEVICLN